MTRYIEAIIFQAVAENMASEQSARMVAMKAASDNARDLIDELTLIYNKNRQAGITKELSEIVAGEFHVHHRADALDDLALGLSVRHVDSFKQFRSRERDQTAAAPLTISESSLVIAAWRVLL